MSAYSPHCELDISRLKQFHSSHFPNQPVPEIHHEGGVKDHTQDKDAIQEDIEDCDDGLGYYEDGVKRTLTDEQISIFRHSETQRLLAARRHEAEAREEDGSKGKDEKIILETSRAGQQKSTGGSKKTAAEQNGVNGHGKRKIYFDEPQDENGDVELEY